MKQTYDEFGDALIAGIEEENHASDPNNKYSLAEKLAEWEKRMNARLDTLDENINSINNANNNVSSEVSHVDDNTEETNEASEESEENNEEV